MKLIGCLLIMLGCAGCGFYGAYAYKTEIALLHSLQLALRSMTAQLKYKLMPLPVLLKEAAEATKGRITDIFNVLSAELDLQASPDVKTCMSVVLSRNSALPPSVTEHLMNLSNSLGKLDLNGQLEGLEYIIERIEHTLSQLEKEKTSRIQLARTIGLCCGIGIAIILL